MSEIKNPWGITASQARALDSFIATGNGKTASKRLGISHAAFSDRTKRAKKKIKAPGNFMYLVHWDRWRQSEGKGIAA